MKKAVLSVGGGCVILIGAVGWLTRGLPLYIVVDGSRATAHMELLGEYPSDVGVIELREVDSAQVIWRVVADKEKLQLHQVAFAAGQNAARLAISWGQARTEIPGDSSEFMLVAGTEYQLRICPSSSWRRCAVETFRLKPV